MLRTYNIIQKITKAVTELFSLRTKIFTLPASSTTPIPYKYTGISNWSMNTLELQAKSCLPSPMD